jgi:hypothetical protein
MPALAAALAAFATTAAAEDDAVKDANRADARCVLAMTVIMRDEAYRQSAAVGIYYFAGRIEARDATVDLASAVRREAGAMQSSQYKAEIARCGAALQAKTKSLEELKGAFGHRGVGG